jgi:hypothetical protein
LANRHSQALGLPRHLSADEDPIVEIANLLDFDFIAVEVVGPGGHELADAGVSGSSAPAFGPLGERAPNDVLRQNSKSAFTPPVIHAETILRATATVSSDIA